MLESSVGARCLLYYLCEFFLAFTCISLPLNLYASVVVVSDLDIIFGGSKDLQKKERVRIFAYPYSHASSMTVEL